MAITLTSSPHPDLLQLRFRADLRHTPAQFELLCAENRDAVLELAAGGRVIVMTSTDGETEPATESFSFSSWCMPSAGRSGKHSIAPQAFNSLTVLS